MSSGQTKSRQAVHEQQVGTHRTKVQEVAEAVYDTEHLPSFVRFGVVVLLGRHVGDQSRVSPGEKDEQIGQVSRQ